MYIYVCVYTYIYMCIYIYMYICTNIYVYQGERWLRPEYRESGLLNLHKTSRIEFFPVGLVGAIVPWNYPFHNVLNPIAAALLSGNAIVIKVRACHRSGAP